MGLNIIALIVLNYVRKTLKNSENFLQWKWIIDIGFILAIAFLVIETTGLASEKWVDIPSIALISAIFYGVFRFPQFQFAKPLVYAWMPLAIMVTIASLVKIISSNFFKRWEDSFDTAIVFSILWAIVYWISIKKQRKALEVERLKAEQREKEFHITESLKAALEVQVLERTAALTMQKEELEEALSELKSAQSQLIQSEKMASLGELTAGIAHEIQNPLNFVNNFSELTNELIGEMKEEIDKGDYEEVKALANDIKQNLEKINHHGKRADSIVKGMLQHSRTSTGKKDPTDINSLLDEFLRLSYHGLRAKDKTFNSDFKTHFAEGLPKVEVVPQDMGRLFLNLINNAFYAVNERKKVTARLPEDGVIYMPTVSVSTSTYTHTTGGAGGIRITISDNGGGISDLIKSKIFQPFFTTKPPGEGTGLGLSLSYDIVKAHGGKLSVESKEGEGTTFTIQIPTA